MRRYLVATVMSLTLLSSISAAIAEDSTTINTKEAPAAIVADTSAPATTSTTTASTEESVSKTAAPAAKSEPKEQKEPKAVKAAKETKATKKDSSSASGIGAVPSRLASFAVGTVVGIPIAMFRHSKEESVNATKDLVGDTDNKFIIAPAGLLGVPAGVLSGTMQGIVLGIKNAWTGSGDEPFSRESFSLGEK